MKHEKEKEKELSRKFQQQKEQYESAIQRQLTFIDQVGKHGQIRAASVFGPVRGLRLVSRLQLIHDKKALNERCEGVVAELKQVDQKYTKKMTQMQEQHEMVSGCDGSWEGLRLLLLRL